MMNSIYKFIIGVLFVMLAAFMFGILWGASVIAFSFGTQLMSIIFNQ